MRDYPAKRKTVPNPVFAMGSLWRTFTAALLPQACFVCGQSAGNGVLCGPCAAELPPAPAPACPVCGLASPQGERCGLCLTHPPRFDATHAVFSYGFPVGNLVQALKFQARFEIAPFLSRALAERLPGEPCDAILPVPLTRARLRERGFNQSALLAQPLARQLRLPLWRSVLIKEGQSGPQVGLDLEARRRNLRGAFRALQRIDGARVLVIDDVMTSGATLDETAAALKAAGAVRVVNLVVARTPPPA